MVRINCRYGRNVFGGILLLAIFSCTLFSSIAKSDEAAEVLLAQCENSYAQANEFWELKKFEEAKALYQSVAQNSSDTSLAIEGWTRVGRCEIQLGNTSAAEQLIEALKNDYAQHKDLCARLYDLSYEYWYKGEHVKSKDHCQYITLGFPDSSLAIKAQRGIARCEIRLGNNSAAEQAIEALKNGYSQHENLCAELHALSYEYLWKGDYDKSKAIWQYVSQKSSDSSLVIKAKAEIAHCEMALGNDSAAKQAIEALKNDYSESPELCNSTLTLAKYYDKLNRYGEAKALCQYVAQNSSDSNLVLTGRTWAGCCELKLGNDSVAEQTIIALMNDHSGSPKLCNSILTLARDYGKLKKFDKAKALYQYVAQNSSDSNLANNARSQVVVCEIRSGNDSAAEQAFEKLWTEYSSEEGFVDIVLGICNVFIEENDPAMALPYINRALQASPNHEKAILLLETKADCYIDMSAGEQANTIIDEIVQNHSANKEFAGTINRIANHYRMRGDYERSIGLHQQSLTKATNDMDKRFAYAGMAKAKARMQGAANSSDVDATVQQLMTNKQNVENLGYHIFQIAEEYYFRAEEARNKGDQEQAQADFQKAIAIWDKNINQITDTKHQAMACYFAAIAYQYLKDYQKSAAYYLKVFTDFSGSEYAAHSLFMVGRYYEKSHRFARGSDTRIVLNNMADPNSLTVPVEAGAVSVNTAKSAYKLLVEKYPDNQGAAYARRWLNKRSSN